MKKITYILGIILLINIAFIVFGNSLHDDRDITKKETSQKKTGNTSGNLLSGGILAENAGWIYYSEPNDKGSIYRKKLNDSSKQKLNDSDSDYLNICGEWIYYRCLEKKRKSIYKMKVDGSHNQRIYKGQINSLSYWDNCLYFTDDSGIYKIGINGTGKKGIVAGWTECVTVLDGWVYYFDLYGECYTRIKTSGTSSQVLFRGNVKQPIVDGEWIYLINEKTNKLIKMKTDGTEKKTISDGVSSNINIQKRHIFYCDGTRIREMKLDGTEDKIFYETSNVLLDFSITENALYYEYRTGTKYNEEFHNKLVLLD